ncbi:hypothetical protein MKX03_037817 [Papaver bracteatum]|nr:hypothetical protein MKX03_037817 [Papaver bracteatum]
MIHATWLKCLKNFIAISSRNSNLFRKVSRETSIPAHHPFSSLAEKQSNSDDTFLNVVKSEIERGEEEFHEALSDFPFKIEGEDVGDRTITLTREYQGDEEIKVTVHIKHYCGRYVDLKGTVSNKTGLTLDFHGTIDATNGFEITSLDVKDPNSSEENTPSHCYGGPAFLDLDEKFKNAFRTYLEDRGIEPSITEVLYDCMVEMKHKKHTGWLKQLKNFLAN